jgi:hypothetical protein
VNLFLFWAAFEGGSAAAAAVLLHTMTFPSFPSARFADCDIFESLLTEIGSHSTLLPLSVGLMTRVFYDVDSRSFLSGTAFTSLFPLLNGLPQAKVIIVSLFAHPRDLPDELFHAFLPGLIDLLETGDTAQSYEVLLLVVGAIDAGCDFADDFLRGLIDRHLDSAARCVAEVVPLLVRRLADPRPYFEWLVAAIDDGLVAAKVAGCLIGRWDTWTLRQQTRLAEVIGERLSEWDFAVKAIVVAGICAIEDPALFASEDVFQRILEFAADSG